MRRCCWHGWRCGPPRLHASASPPPQPVLVPLAQVLIVPPKVPIPPGYHAIYEDCGACPGESFHVPGGWVGRERGDTRLTAASGVDGRLESSSSSSGNHGTEGLTEARLPAALGGAGSKHRSWNKEAPSLRIIARDNWETGDAAAQDLLWGADMKGWEPVA